MANSMGVSQAGDLMDRFYAALEAGDIEAAKACCSSDCEFWHNFDAIAQNLDDAGRGWAGMVAMFPERRAVDVRRAEIPGGIVQRHLFVLGDKDGQRKAKPACLFVRVANSLITRVDEYIDLAGSLSLEQDVVHTPGLSVGPDIV